MRSTIVALCVFALAVFAACSMSSDAEKRSEAAAAAKTDKNKDAKHEGVDGYMPEPEPMEAAKEESKADDKAGDDGGPGGGKGGGKKKTTWKRSVQVANTSALMVGDHEEMEIKGMHVRSQVDGFRARVLIDFFFYNPDDQRYEGTFKLRLPEGASPMFLAFGESTWEAPKYGDAGAARKQGYEPKEVVAERAASWVKPKIARMVQKEKAAHAYGSTVRRAIDPALMEWAGAGIFNARIFPITPRKLHRVVVAYDVDLTPIGGDLELQIPIPEGVPSSTMDLNIAKPKGTKITVGPKAERFPEGDREFYRLEDLAGQTVTIRLANAQGVALQGGDPLAGKFFAAALQPKLPTTAKVGGPDHAVFAVDTSMSSNPDRFNVYLALMKAILDNNRKQIKTFAVMFFSNDARWWQKAFVPNEPGQVDALMKFAGTLTLEGATDLAAALGEASHPSWAAKSEPGYDCFLLSDGAATWGPAEAFQISAALQDGHARSVFAYRTGMAGGDAAMLNHITRESGGAVFSVVGESEVDAASKAHNQRAWRIQKVELEGADDVLLGGRPTALFPDQRLFVVGRGSPKRGAAVVLSLEQSGGAVTVKVPISALLESDLTPRSYGQVAVNQLEEFVPSTESVATAFARHFRVTGKTASLLMLDSDAEYERFGIKPKEDGALVAAKRVSPILELSLAETNKRTSKSQFLARLERLKSMPGVELTLKPELRELLQALPDSAYDVPSVPLRTKAPTRTGVSSMLLEELSEQKPSYDTATLEAQRRLKEYGPDDALKALSSMVEASPGDGVLGRDVGFSAMEWGLHAQAYRLFTRVADSRPYEPQTYRAIAASLADAGKSELALAYFELALAGRWDQRFGEFRQIVLQDYLRFLRSKKRLTPAVADFAKLREGAVGKEVEVAEADIVVTITWNTDNTDVDLHVVEPSGEECYYGHNRTRSGGKLTRDVTQGYGPEMYVLPTAPKGKYRVRAKYYASDVNRASARSKVYATITRNWGKPGEKTERKVVMLESGKEMHDLLIVSVD